MLPLAIHAPALLPSFHGGLDPRPKIAIVRKDGSIDYVPYDPFGGATKAPDSARLFRRASGDTLIHESAHALMACLVDIPFVSVTSVATKKAHGRLAGLPPATQGTCAQHVWITLAGPVAEARYTGEPLAKILSNGGSSDLADARRILLGCFPHLREKTITEILQKSVGKVQKIIVEHWSAVSAVARALDEQGVLSATEVEAIVEGSD